VSEKENGMRRFGFKTGVVSTSGTSGRTRRALKVFVPVLVVLVAALAFAGVASATTLGDSTASSAPWIQSDQGDYAPGALVTLTGGNWAAGESVHINVNDDQGKTWSRDVDVTAASDGTVSDAFNLPTTFIATYAVTATAASGTATAAFTDGNVQAKLVGGPTSATFSWTKWNGNTTCSSGPTSVGTTSVTTTYTTLTGAGNGQSVFVTAPSIIGYTFSGWSGDVTSSSAAICVAGSLGSPQVTATYVASADTTAPAIAITSPADNSSTASSTANVSGTASDASDIQSVTVNGNAATFGSGTWSYTGLSLACGSNTITAVATDNSSNHNTNSTSITVTRTCDTAAPANASIGIDGGDAWTNSTAATVSISATDDVGIASYRLAQTQSGLVSATAVAVSPEAASFSASGVSFTLSSGDGAAKAAWVRFCDAADNCTDVSDTIGLDTVAPKITGDTGTYTPGAWTNQSVTVSFTCADDQGTVSSGVDTNTVAGDTLTGSGLNQSVTNTGVCTDNAGNTADSATVGNIDIDKVKPVIEAAAENADHTAYTAGTWTNQSVTVGFSCSDGGGSGLASNSVGGGGTQLAETSSGSFTNSGSCTDNAGNSADSVTFSPIKIDKTDPVITATAENGDHTAYTAGTWTNQSVTVSFSCSDAGSIKSGVASEPLAISGGGTQSTETSTGSFSSTESCTDAAGNSADAATFSPIKVDKTKPKISGDTGTYTPGTWTNQSVTVSFTCDDDQGTANSGVATDTVAGATLTGSGENQTVTNTGTCTDTAGNTADSATVGNIDIDKVKPVVSVDTGTYAPGTWTNQDVTVSFTCADTGTPQSGIATDTVGGGTTVSTSSATTAGATVTSTGSCVDDAGNEADAGSVTVKMDKTPPVISDSGVHSGTAGLNGWYVSAVTNGFTATDALSGLDTTCSIAFPKDVSTGMSEGSAVTVASGSCSDTAGNSNSGISSASFKIDLTNPTVDSWTGGPADGASYYYGLLPAAPTCTAADGGSGPKSCVVTGYSTAVGQHTLTATATDNAGRTGTDTRTYTVLAWTLSGFYQPVDMNGVLNSVKAGSTVPLKFELFAGQTELTALSAVSGLTYRAIGCSATAPVDDVELTATGGTSLRYDTTAGQYIYNWQSPKAIGCYQVTMTAQDGSTLVALFKLK
jgi:hypothetical protein